MGSRPSCVRRFIERSRRKCNDFSRVGVQTRNRRCLAHIDIVTHILQYSRVYDLHPSQTTVTLLPTEVKNWAAIMTWSSCLYANRKGICLGIPLLWIISQWCVELAKGSASRSYWEKMCQASLNIQCLQPFSSTVPRKSVK